MITFPQPVSPLSLNTFKGQEMISSYFKVSGLLSAFEMSLCLGFIYSTESEIKVSMASDSS